MCAMVKSFSPSLSSILSYCDKPLDPIKKNTVTCPAVTLITVIDTS